MYRRGRLLFFKMKFVVELQQGVALHPTEIHDQLEALAVFLPSQAEQEAEEVQLAQVSGNEPPEVSRLRTLLDATAANVEMISLSSVHTVATDEKQQDQADDGGVDDLAELVGANHIVVPHALSRPVSVGGRKSATSVPLNGAGSSHLSLPDAELDQQALKDKQLLLAIAFDDTELHSAAVQHTWLLTWRTAAYAMSFACVSLAFMTPYAFAVFPRCDQAELDYFTVRSVSYTCSSPQTALAFVGENLVVVFVSLFPAFTLYLLTGRAASTRLRWEVLLWTSLVVVARCAVDASVDFSRSSSLRRALNTSLLYPAVLAGTVSCALEGGRQLESRAFRDLYLKGHIAMYILVWLPTRVMAPFFASTSSESTRVIILFAFQSGLVVLGRWGMTKVASALSRVPGVTNKYVMNVVLMSGLHSVQRLFVYGLGNLEAQVLATLLFAMTEVLGRCTLSIRKLALEMCTSGDFTRAIVLAEEFRYSAWRMRLTFLEQVVENYAICYTYFVVVLYRLLAGTPVMWRQVTGILVLQYAGEVLSDVAAGYFERAYMERPPLVQWLRDNFKWTMWTFALVAIVVPALSLETSFLTLATLDEGQ